jgi:hypothetical protein
LENLGQIRGARIRGPNISAPWITIRWGRAEMLENRPFLF